MIMKKFINSLFVIIAAMVAFSACVKEEDSPVNQTKTVRFFAESIETKTAFGAPDGKIYPVLWTDNDKKVGLSLNLADPKDADVVVADDYLTASFEAEITDDASGAYMFYAMSPATAINSFNKNNKYLSAIIPTAQTPLEGSVDEAAQILYAKSEVFSEMPSSVSLNFRHYTAYGKISLKNLELGDAVVSSVSLTSDVDIAGRWNYYVEEDRYSVNSGAKTITLLTSDTETIWFACAPVDVSGTKMTVAVNTDKGRIEKTITFDANRVFKAGKIVPFTVDMDGYTIKQPDVYELVNDPSELNPECEIIIVAAESNMALSTTQNPNNRATASVTKSGNTITGTDGVQIITVEDGAKPGTIALNVGEGYLYAASSSNNYLRTESTLSDNSSWIITIDKGIATIKAQGSNTRNWMRYNYNSGNPMFSCYASGQNDVSIYKRRGSGIANYIRVSPAVIEIDSDETSVSFTVASDVDWTATPSDGASVEVVGNVVNVNFAENEASESQIYTVTVSAEGVEPEVVTITQAGYVPVMTVAEILAKEDGASVKVEGMVLGKYKRGILISDGENEIIAYDASGVSSEVGDKVCVTGIKGDFNGLGQIDSPETEVISSNNTLTYPSLNITDGAALDALVNTTEVEYIQYEGTLAISDNYYNVTVDGATTAIGSLQYPLDGLGLSSKNGKKVRITGFYVGTSSSKYVNTLVTDVEVLEEGGENPEPGEGDSVTISVTFSDYTAGKQYAIEKHTVGKDGTTFDIHVEQCHFTSELRIYSSSTHNGYAYSDALPGNITKMTFNAGNNVDCLNVYGSADGNTWTLVAGVNITSASYNDYTVDFAGTSYNRFKLDVEGGNQIRIKTLSVTYSN